MLSPECKGQRDARVNSSLSASGWLSLNASAAACVNGERLDRVIVVFCSALAHHGESKVQTAMHSDRFLER